MRKGIAAAVAAMGLILAVGTVGYLSSPATPTPAPTPAPAPDALAVAAKLYAGNGSIAKAQAAAWRIEAAAIRSGSKVADAQVAGQAAAKSAREAAFAAVVTPHLAAILPDGADVKDQPTREKLAAALDKMAAAVDPATPPPARGPPAVVGSPDSEKFGWVDRPAARNALAATLPHRTLTLAAPGLAAADDPKDVFLYKAWTEVLGSYPDYPAQQIGDCTSFGSGHALDLLQCIDIAIAGGTRDLYRETSTECIYGVSREIAGLLGSGDGSYGVASAKALTDVGAVPREAVGPYSGSRAKQFGRTGTPANFKAIARDHKLGSATLVTTTAEADAALANGYPFIVCSNQGFTMQRNADGVCEARGSWAHCMFVAGARTRAGERQYLVCQSWGSKTPSGPTTDDQPPFSFWVRGNVMARMLAGEDSLAFSRFAGFVPRPIPDRWTYSGFAQPRPAAGPKPEKKTKPAAVKKAA